MMMMSKKKKPKQNPEPGTFAAFCQMMMSKKKNLNKTLNQVPLRPFVMPVFGKGGWGGMGGQVYEGEGGGGEAGGGGGKGGGAVRFCCPECRSCFKGASFCLV
jgi:hypothetical protein